jgi:4-hydroxyphenylpyruvate dioxygenase
MGFAEVARHRSKAVTVYRQGDIDHLINEEPNRHAAHFAALHGPCAASMGFRVVDAQHAYERALSLGAAHSGKILPSCPTLLSANVLESGRGLAA